MTGPQRKQLYHALLSAFPTPDDLRRLALFHLDKVYVALVHGNDLRNIVLSLIATAEARAELMVLLDAAQAENPTNPALLAITNEFMAELYIAPSTSVPVPIHAPVPTPPTNEFTAEIHIAPSTPASAPIHEPTSAAPITPTLSPIERAERYRDIKEATAKSEWQRVLELARGLEGYRDVRQLIDRSQQELNNQSQLLDEIADAYALGDWTQVIILARQWGAAMPPDLIKWVRKAWQEVPVTEKVLVGHEGAVLAAVITPNQKYLLSGGEDGTIRLWDLANGQLVHMLSDSTGPVHTIAVTPNGRQLLSGTCEWGSSRESTITLWDLMSGRQLRKFTDLCVYDGGWSLPIAIMPDGNQVLSTSKDFDLVLWDIATGQILRKFPSSVGLALALVITSDGRLALAGSNKKVAIWDLTVGEAVHLLDNHDSAVQGLALTPDGRHAISGSWDQTLCLLDLADGKTIKILGKPHMSGGHWVASVAVTPDGLHAVSGGKYKSTIQLWDLANGSIVRTLTGHSADIRSVAITADGRTIASGALDGTVRLWKFPLGLLGPLR